MNDLVIIEKEKMENEGILAEEKEVIRGHEEKEIFRDKEKKITYIDKYVRRRKKR